MIEGLSGSTQFGHGFDEWGHHFTLDNSNHLRHEVVAAGYLKRNPDLPLRSAMQNVSDHGSNAKVFAITRRPRFELLTGPPTKSIERAIADQAETARRLLAALTKTPAAR